MYKRIILEKFERKDYCTIDDDAFNDIKRDIEHHVNMLNKGINEGRDYLLDSYMQAYHNELNGMKTVCINIGINVVIKKEEY